MAELKYSKNGHLLFTKEMKKEYKILAPNMLPVHFELIRNIFVNEGYDMELLQTNNPEIISQGLQSVHNDTCYPCLLVVGQFIEALKSGKYDPDKTALIITQTGGGCRASNYIHLLRKALKKSGFEQIPVISLNLSGLERNSGFKLSLMLILKMISAMLYGDILMLLSNQVRPYELEKGTVDAKTEKWIKKLADMYKTKSGFRMKDMKKNFSDITEDFAKIPVLKTDKVKVGIVGEIYVKYSPLANNDLEKFLFNEGAEVVVPGLLDFILFKFDNRIVDIDLYGGSRIKYKIVSLLKNYMLKTQKILIEIIKESGKFDPPISFEEKKKMVEPFIGYGAKMGEGWLLTAEMVELVHSGVHNVVCAQPFGCLPNHIVGKGMIRKIISVMPEANIVSIDYDPGATKVNQENRLKLMLATAKDRALSDMTKVAEHTKKEAEMAV